MTIHLTSAKCRTITLPNGINIPGTYVLKYFTLGSPLPLSVSDRFEVGFLKSQIVPRFAVPNKSRADFRKI